MFNTPWISAIQIPWKLWKVPMSTRDQSWIGVSRTPVRAVVSRQLASPYGHRPGLRSRRLAAAPADYTHLMSHPTPTAVLLIAHGSRHQPANDDLHRLAGRFAARGDHPIVEPCFLELAAPEIPEGGDRCVERGAKVVLMIPYFLSEGIHLTRDLVAARDDLAARHPGVAFRLGKPLGPDPLLDELVARRIGECGGVDESAENR